MNVIFICGPYRAENEVGIIENIKRAEKWSAQFWADGLAVICPHKNSALMGGAIPEKLFLDGYLEILSRCDILFVMPGWEKSEGARAEIKEARRLRLDIIYGE
jgi:hypothetical protein